MTIQRDKLYTNLSNTKRGYDRLYLEITVEVNTKND